MPAGFGRNVFPPSGLIGQWPFGTVGVVGSKAEEPLRFSIRIISVYSSRFKCSEKLKEDVPLPTSL